MSLWDAPSMCSLPSTMQWLHTHAPSSRECYPFIALSLECGKEVSQWMTSLPLFYAKLRVLPSSAVTNQPNSREKNISITFYLRSKGWCESCHNQCNCALPFFFFLVKKRVAVICTSGSTTKNTAKRIRLCQETTKRLKFNEEPADFSAAFRIKELDMSMNCSTVH